MISKTLLFIFFCCTVSDLFGQISYSGFIGKYPIELLTNAHYEGTASAIYVYKNHNEPIVISGQLSKGVLKLYEKDKQDTNTASLIFEKFDTKTKTLKGVWTDLKTNKQYKIELVKDFDLDHTDSTDSENLEIIQPVSLPNSYFKLLVSKDKNHYSQRVTGIKIIDKKTNKLIQKIDLHCQLWGLDNVSVGDFNFDGKTDFSVFESSYAGPNTSSLYFLYDSSKNQYFDSGFTGVSLGFDSLEKRIFEHNQCCAGQIHTTATYKVEANKMVLIEEHCFIWDEEKQDLVEREMKDCQ